MEACFHLFAHSLGCCAPSHLGEGAHDLLIKTTNGDGEGYISSPSFILRIPDRSGNHYKPLHLSSVIQVMPKRGQRHAKARRASQRQNKRWSGDVSRETSPLRRR